MSYGRPVVPATGQAMKNLAAVALGPLAALVAAAAWEPWRGYVPAPGKKTLVFGALWLVAALTTWRVYWGRSTFWDVVALLVELAGVTYLAREVCVAREGEASRKGMARLEPFLALEAFADHGDYDEYITRFYKLDGMADKQAQADILLTKLCGTFELEAKKLRNRTRASFERPKEILANMAFRHPRARLVTGAVLVALGVTGHRILSVAR
jgi:hypothetical protein